MNLPTSPGRVTVVEGDPSPRSIKSPRQITYISEIKTLEARKVATSQTKDVYTGADAEIANQQLRSLRDVNNYITAIRHDEFASPEERLRLIQDIPAIEPSAAVAQAILDLDDAAWQVTAAEAHRVLDLIMRDEIRTPPGPEIARQARLFTSYALSEQQREIVVALAPNLVVPNSFFDAEQTAMSKQAAEATVEPVLWTLREGESIVREGEIVSAFALEKLAVLGLLEAKTNWQSQAGVVLFSLILVTALGAYIARCQPLLLARPRRELLLLLLLIIFGLVARLTIPGHTVIPYLFPAAAAAMLLTILLDLQLALVVSAIVAVLVGYNAAGSIELVVYALIGGMVGALALWRMDNLASFVRAALYVAVANMTVVLAFRLHSQFYDMVGLVQLLGVSIGNAVLSSSLAFVAFAFIGKTFGVTTSLQLLDLARPTHPLFRQLLIKAPATYHHSIIISNMAERAAEAIGADSLLARVGSYYHDVGKTIRPYFFAENQSDGVNPHDELDAQTSAEIIISHVTDGLALAHKYGLPDRVQDFISEHHGTMLVMYFYRHAAEQNGGETLNESAYRYPGPRPQSRETAIVMLADGIEASVRAHRPSTQAETERIIRQVINDRLVSGQLDECDLTLRDLDKIRQAFVSVLQGVFHPRIQYPERVQSRVLTASPDTPSEE